MGYEKAVANSHPLLPPPPFLLEKERKELPKKTKLLTAAAIFFGNVTFGCVFNAYGPVLTSLQTKYDTDDATISKVFTIMTGCYMIGALLGGIIYDYVNRQLAVILILSTMASTMFLTPHCPTMPVFFMSAGVLGFCCGSYDGAQFVWMMEMMQKDCPPYVLASQFFYGVGANLPALIMAPFLDKGEGSDDGSGSNDKLIIPFTILGLLISAAALFQTLLFILFRYHAPPADVSEPEPEKTKEELKLEEPVIGSWSWPKLRLVILTCFFLSTYQGQQICTFAFFSKFGQNSELHLSESEAAYVFSGMTAAFAVGRGVATLVIFKVSAQLLICANLLFLFVANILLTGWATRSLAVLWTSGVLFGLGYSSLYPSFSAFIQRYLYFTNFIGSLVPFWGAVFASLYPLVVGSFIEGNPNVLGYTCFFSISFMLISFGWVSFLTHKSKTRY